VIVVEHDEDAIRHADYVVDLGPGAGVHGGKIISQGTPEHITNDPESITGQYLSGRRAIAVPAKRTPIQKDRALRGRECAAAITCAALASTFPSAS